MNIKTLKLLNIINYFVMLIAMIAIFLSFNITPIVWGGFDDGPFVDQRLHDFNIQMWELRISGAIIFILTFWGRLTIAKKFNSGANR